MLTPAQRKALKARAHKLEPVVLIGAKGMTEAVVAEVDVALKAHELIKVRASGLEREERTRAFEEICARTGADLVTEIGIIGVLYRKKPDAG